MVVGPASVTPAARKLLAGRAVLLRVSPRHGCCGGTALVPVVEAVDTSDPDLLGLGDVDTTVVDGVDVLVDGRLGDGAARWSIDVDGLLGWRRLALRDASPR